MAMKSKTARPAARKQQPNTKTAKKTVAKSSRPEREPIPQVVERPAPRVIAEPVKLKGELPVPTSTFYF
jgi:hypothetical protein